MKKLISLLLILTLSAGLFCTLSFGAAAAKKPTREEIQTLIASAEEYAKKGQTAEGEQRWSDAGDAYAQAATLYGKAQDSANRKSAAEKAAAMYGKAVSAYEKSQPPVTDPAAMCAAAAVYRSLGSVYQRDLKDTEKAKANYTAAAKLYEAAADAYQAAAEKSTKAAEKTNLLTGAASTYGLAGHIYAEEAKDAASAAKAFLKAAAVYALLEDGKNETAAKQTAADAYMKAGEYYAGHKVRQYDTAKEMYRSAAKLYEELGVDAKAEEAAALAENPAGSNLASVLSYGEPWIVISVAVIAVAVIAVLTVKKKKSAG